MRQKLTYSSISWLFTATRLALLTLIANLAAGLVTTTATSTLGLPLDSERNPSHSVIESSRLKPSGPYHQGAIDHLFGIVAQVDSPVQDSPVIELPGLKLRGVTLHQNPADSFCVIEDERTHRQDLYRVGETILGTEIAIKMVEWDRILVDRGRGNESFELASFPTENLRLHPGSDAIR